MTTTVVDIVPPSLTVCPDHRLCCVLVTVRRENRSNSLGRTRSYIVTHTEHTSCRGCVGESRGCGRSDIHRDGCPR